MPTAEKHKANAAMTMVAEPVAPVRKIAWLYSPATIVPEMALYYGFQPLDQVLGQRKLEKQDERLATDLADRIGQLFSLKEKIALLRQYFARNPGAAPLAVFSEKPERKIPGRAAQVTAEYHLTIIGSARPTAESLLIKLCYEIAREQYATTGREICLELNSVGERESFSRFSRDITAHFRKHMEGLHADCRQDFKKSPFAPVSCGHAECKALRHTMPESVSFLSEPSRHHFMAVLEHLEAASVPYALDKELIFEPDIVQHSIFRVSVGQAQIQTQAQMQTQTQVQTQVGDTAAPASSPDAPTPLLAPIVVARGSRWGGLGRRMGFKKDVLGVSAIIRVPLRRAGHVASHQKKMQPPAFYFIHIGHDALLKSLNVIEDLRRARIAVHHALLKDKMGIQLGSAEACGVPYILIMGQKESMENTVLVRRMLTRSQETVPLTRLAQYLKKIIDKS